MGKDQRESTVFVVGYYSIHGNAKNRITVAREKVRSVSRVGRAEEEEAGVVSVSLYLSSHTAANSLFDRGVG
jgi:hypothetical protein